MKTNLGITQYLLALSAGYTAFDGGLNVITDTAHSVATTVATPGPVSTNQIIMECVKLAGGFISQILIIYLPKKVQQRRERKRVAKAAKQSS